MPREQCSDDCLRNKKYLFITIGLLLCLLLCLMFIHYLPLLKFIERKYVWMIFQIDALPQKLYHSFQLLFSFCSSRILIIEWNCSIVSDLLINRTYHKDPGQVTRVGFTCTLFVSFLKRQINFVTNVPDVRCTKTP